MRYVLPFLLTVLATPAAAQWQQVPNSGCRPMNSIVGINGMPRLGQGIGVVIRCNQIPDVPYLMAGLPQTPMIPVPPPIACTPVACNLAVIPAVTVRGTASAVISFSIPNDPALIGAILRFQGLCLTRATACVTLSGALDAVIQP